MSELKLNLGAGAQHLEGFTAVEIKNDQGAFPLGYPDASAAEIRASHILEHFSHRNTADVLKDWVRVLKPGGRIRVAVPDFDHIVDGYKSGSEEPIEAYLMGGHTDNHDVHLAMFNREKLGSLMADAGLVDIRPWTSGNGDCASLPVSLNLEGTKPESPVQKPQTTLPVLKVGAAMSVPRLGFMDNFFCAFQSLLPLKIGLRKHTGAFWGQCLERCFGYVLEDGVDAVLAIDYDTLFTGADVLELIRLMREHPAADAIAALQASRSKPTPLITMRDDDGKKICAIDRRVFDPDITRVATAHFGLTLIRASSLKEMPHPWFKGEPGPTGEWDADRIDEDIWFWKQWEKHGKSLFQANRVVIGHAELMVRWPDVNCETIYQHPSEFFDKGKPEGVRK